MDHAAEGKLVETDEESDDELELPAATLEALKEFALEQHLDVNISSMETLREQIQEKCDIADKEEIFEYTFSGTNEEQITVELKGVKKELGQTLSSTGLTIWRAAEELARFTVENPELFNGKTVLECGAGLGLNGILISKVLKDQANKICITDGDDDTLELLQQNVNSNGPYSGQVSVEKLYWGEHSAFVGRHGEQSFEVIIGADIIYEKGQIRPLIETVRDLLHPEGIFLLAYARRNVPVEHVLGCAEENGLIWSEASSFVPQNSSENIYIFSRTPSCS
mmetsp:Transcript_55740/g.81451  ORF Transcript_55740/g.81451 Transcript_55740/m.81451 type:complete len:280 (-) Transcript_55740:143-982(-)